MRNPSSSRRPPAEFVVERRVEVDQAELWLLYRAGDRFVAARLDDAGSVPEKAPGLPRHAIRSIRWRKDYLPARRYRASEVPEGFPGTAARVEGSWSPVG